MKAAVLRKVNKPLQVEDLQVANPAHREALVRTAATGVCHSDLHFVEGKYSIDLPLVPGHEAAGTVLAVGDQVSYVGPGDCVIVSPSVFCGECKQCVRGRPFLCTRMAEMGRSAADPPALSRGDERITQIAGVGAYAEEMLVHEQHLVKVPDDIDASRLALLGCGVITGVGAVLNTAQVEPGSTVAVIGCGGIGLNCIQGAVIAGALRIIAVDSVASKLETAQQFGATDLVDASRGETVEQILELTSGGVDYSFEAVGRKELVEQAFDMLGPGGTATVIGMVPQGVKVELDGPSILFWERHLQGSQMGSTRLRIDIPRFIEFYRQGRLKLDELVSQQLPLERINEAFSDLTNGRVARSVITFE